VHVGLNLLFLVPGETGGMKVYARELVAAFASERPDLRLTVFVNREAPAAGGSWEAHSPRRRGRRERSQPCSVYAPSRARCRGSGAPPASV